MSEFVLMRWIRVAGLVAATLVVWALLAPNGLPWMGLVLLGLAFSGALWLGMTFTRSIAQMIGAIEEEPPRAVALAVGRLRSGRATGIRGRAGSGHPPR